MCTHLKVNSLLRETSLQQLNTHEILLFFPFLKWNWIVTKYITHAWESLLKTKIMWIFKNFEGGKCSHSCCVELREDPAAFPKLSNENSFWGLPYWRLGPKLSVTAGPGFYKIFMDACPGLRSSFVGIRSWSIHGMLFPPEIGVKENKTC